MGRINGVGGIERVSSPNLVVEFSRNVCTGGDVNDSLGHGLLIWVDSAVANEVV